jgi:hypothetical protein
MTTTTGSTSDLRDDAAAAHAAYRQYDGYFANWVAGEIVTRQTRGKSGVSAIRGDIVLMAPTTETVPGCGEAMRAFYSTRTGNVTLVEASKIATIETYVRFPGGLVWFAA